MEGIGKIKSTERSPFEPFAKRGLSHQMDQLEKRPELSLYTIGL